MDQFNWLSDDDESSSQVESEVSGTISDLSQEIDCKSSANQMDSPDDSLDAKDEDIYESLLKSSEEKIEVKESPKVEERDPIAELEAFLKAIHGDEGEGDVKPRDESFVEENVASMKIPQQNDVGKLKRKRIKSPKPTRVLRPRSRLYWSESSLSYLKTQENIYSYYSDLRKKRI